MQKTAPSPIASLFEKFNENRNQALLKIASKAVRVAQEVALATP